MELDKIKNKGRAQIFKNPVLESLTKTRPWMIYSIYISVNSFLIFYSYSSLRFGASFIAVLFFIAMFSWTLFEYIAHRYLFHYHATSKLGQRIVYIFHGNHHEYPRDTSRLFMPPVPSIIFSFIIWCLIWMLSYLFAGTGIYAFIYFPGFTTGYLLYVSMHYAIHAYSPPQKLKFLWRNHHLHHYKYPDKAFGVSSSFWDMVFGTLPEKDKEN